MAHLQYSTSYFPKGAFVKVTARMDAMQQDVDDLRNTVVNAQGQVQVQTMRKSGREILRSIVKILRRSRISFVSQGTRFLVVKMVIIGVERERLLNSFKLMLPKFVYTTHA